MYKVKGGVVVGVGGLNFLFFFFFLGGGQAGEVSKDWVGSSGYGRHCGWKWVVVVCGGGGCGWRVSWS